MYKASVTSRVFSFKLRLHYISFSNRLIIICVVSEMRLPVCSCVYILCDMQKKKPIKSCTLPHERAKRRSVFSPLSFFSFLPCFVSALNERAGTRHTCVK